MVVGRGAGGVLGVLAFIATWIYCIREFGLVFGGALGWVPAAIVGMVLSVVVAWLWLPLVLLVVFVVTAPAWDKGGAVHKATVRSGAFAVRTLKRGEAMVRKAAIWTRDEARREGLTKE